MENFFCAEASQQAEEVPIGSAGNYEIYLLTECPPPWASMVLDSKAISAEIKVRSLKFAEEMAKAKIRLRPLFIYNENLHQEDSIRVLILRKPQGLAMGYSKQEFQLQNRDEVIPVFRDWLAGNPPKTAAIESNSRDILVCTHGSHDRCCARYGKPFYYQALATVEKLSLTDVRVWQCTHFGGHRFAPTAIDLPSGRWYGRLDESAFTSILTCTGDLDCLNRVYRGWGFLPNVAQVLEQELFLKYGWDWLNYQVNCRIIEQSAVGDFYRVEINFITPEQQQGCYRAEVIEDESKTVYLEVGCSASEASKLPKFSIKNLTKVH